MEIQFRSDITVLPIQHCGNDTVIAGAAWVSTSGADAEEKAKADSQKVPGLIRYLMKHRHGSPFEHGSLTMCVHAPIFVWREWHRHRVGWSYNEESGRYKTLDPVFYLPPSDRPMMKVDNWKAGRPKFDKAGQGTHSDITRNLMSVYIQAYQKYLENLDLGIDPGLARDCLPLGIYSSCWVTANPRSLMHFLSLRTHEPTAAHVSYPLYEIDVAARKVESLFAKLWPVTHAAWVECGRIAP